VRKKSWPESWPA